MVDPSSSRHGQGEHVRETLDLLGLLRLASLRSAPAPAAGPNPTPLGSVIPPERVEGHRSFFCDRYDACLDSAYHRRWPSWSCARCGLFQALRPVRGPRAPSLARRLVSL